MEEWFINIMKEETVLVVYFIILLSSSIEYAFPPFPGDMVMLFGAFMAGKEILPLEWVFILSTLGSFLGSMGIYAFGATMGRNYFIKKDFSFFSEEKVHSLEGVFARWGGAIIILNRFTPGFRSFFFIAAGIAKMPAIKVAFFSLISILLWNTGIAYLGFAAGANWDALKELMKSYSNIVLMFISLALLIYITYRVILRLMNRRRERQSPQ